MKDSNTIIYEFDRKLYDFDMKYMILIGNYMECILFVPDWSEKCQSKVQGGLSASPDLILSCDVTDPIPPPGIAEIRNYSHRYRKNRFW